MSPKLNKAKQNNPKKEEESEYPIISPHSSAAFLPEVWQVSGLTMGSTALLPFIIFLSLSPLSLSLSETDALLKFKKSLTEKKDSFDSWNPSSSPCNKQNQWKGIICNNGIVTGIHLTELGLSGKIDVDALREIQGLRTLSFMNNFFSGPIPDFHHLGAIKALYLSGNDFSGEIASDYFSKMASLKKIWLAGNGFSGKIPDSLMRLPHLIELHLEKNKFTGPIPPFEQNSLTSLNLSGNNLEGEIPAMLSKFDATSFEGNDKLCGKQLKKECNSPPPPSSLPPPSSTLAASPSHNVAITAVIVIIMVLALILTTILSKSRKEDDFDLLGKENLDEMVNVHVPGSTHRRETSRKGSDSRRGSHNGRSMMGDLIMVNDQKGVFGLQDLMKASAEVLGNGGLGSAYKAVMANGLSVVVKRMREMNRLGRDGFDAEIKMIGRLHHRNILTPLAYHYRKEEKLLISEYVRKGSLLYVLHGDRGIAHAELNWPTRLKIIQGITRGMGFLHSEYASADLPHGNLKSSNVLLGTNFEALLTDYALYPLINSTQATQALFAFKSPEYTQYQQVSPKSDVYCLGLIILEILTGKFPSQYLNTGKGGIDIVEWVQSATLENKLTGLIDPEIANAKDSSLGVMESLLHIGAACTKSNPEQRLDMREAVRRVEEVQI